MSDFKDNELDNEQGSDTVTLNLDDGTDVECVVLTTLEVGDCQYIALLPVEGSGYDEDEAFLYRYELDENEDPILYSLESDDEYEAVADAFDEWLDELAFNEMPENE